MKRLKKLMTKVNGERRVIEERTVKTSKADFREYLAATDGGAAAQK